MKKVIIFINKFMDDIFISLGLYFIAKAGFLIYTPLGYLVLGVFFMGSGLKMLQGR